MCISVYEFLSSRTGLVTLLATALGLCAALAYLYTKLKPIREDEEESEDEEEVPEPRKLRMRPLKPAIDTSIYEYGHDQY